MVLYNTWLFCSLELNHYHVLSLLLITGGTYYRILFLRVSRINHQVTLSLCWCSQSLGGAEQHRASWWSVGMTVLRHWREFELKKKKDYKILFLNDFLWKIASVYLSSYICISISEQAGYSLSIWIHDLGLIYLSTAGNQWLMSFWVWINFKIRHRQQEILLSSCLTIVCG